MGIISYVQLLGGALLPENLEKQKTSKICHDSIQLLTLTANISGTGLDIDNLKQNSLTAILSELNKKVGELSYTNNKVTLAYVYLPKIDCECNFRQL